MHKGRKTELGGWQEKMILLGQAERKGYGGTDLKEGKKSKLGIGILGAIGLSLLGILIARLIYLQVFERGQHTLLSATNHLEKIGETAPRGIIYDRRGAPLAVNKEVNGKLTREYPAGAAGAPLTGYIAEVTENEIGCREGFCNEPGMWTGRAGIEKTEELTLRGRDGGRLVELDATGKEVRELGTNEAEQGTDVYLSVDAGLQKIMAEAMGSRVGSAVAIDMQGKVLGMVSNPSYDPNLFTVKPNGSLLQNMLQDNDKQYFLDRPLSGVYPPGSVFKLVTAYAGLEDGKIDKDTLIEDTGEIRIDKYRYGNWYFDQYGRKEGEISVERAIGRSNDVFFYKLGEMVGVDRLVLWAKKFGYGEPTGIELPGEVRGLVPDRLWKERATGEKWFLGNTYHMAIGQGDLQVTPAQVARATLGAVSGRKCRLSVLRDSKVDCEDIGLKPENIDIVREGMRQVCAAGGTAFPFFDFQPWVMCKTGTAQHSGQIINSEMSTDNQVKPHAWITVAYPGENPEMVLTVMLDSAGEGSYEAGPVARQILEKWRDLKK